MPELFSYEDAVALLPEVRRRVERFAATMRAGRARSGRVSQLAEHNGHDTPSFAVAQKVRSQLRWFDEHGVQLKGVDPVLVDFPHDAGGRVVLLCWRQGEDTIGWWHDQESGFAGRRPIDEL